MKVLLAAEEAAGVQALHLVRRSGHEVVAVLTSRAGRAGSRSPVHDAAAELGCPVWPADEVKDPRLAERVRAAGVDVLLNVHSLFLIRPEVLAACRLGAYNMHPGRLPEYAGLNTISWALYHGEPTHAVTIHRIAPRVDAGPIAYQTTFPIAEQDTALTLGVKGVKAGLPLIERLLAALAGDPSSVPSIPQDLARRRYYGRDVPQAGRLDWSRPARAVVNFVRACDYVPFHSPWGHPRTRLAGRAVAVVKARLTGERSDQPPGTVGRVVGDGVLVATVDEWVLVHRVLIGERVVPAAQAVTPDGAMPVEAWSADA